MKGGERKIWKRKLFLEKMDLKLVEKTHKNKTILCKNDYLI